ncbi:MAG: antibiotic biosynthesis monooxygenase family protein [Gammaproteobacteria bacterium]
MKKDDLSSKSKRFYRVDKFVVPDRAREEFISKVRNTHELLRTLPGFLQDLVLEQSSGPGEFNFVTIVEWDGVESIENAKTAVMAMHKKTNFNPQEMLARLGIKADLANYRKIDA